MRIADLKEGSTIDGLYFLRDLSSHRTGKDRQYLELELGDRSGKVRARCTESESGSAGSLKKGDFVHVTGLAEEFQGRMSIRVDLIKPADVSSRDLRHFMPSAYRDISELAGYLAYFLTEVYDPDYSRLLGAIFNDDAFMERFSTAPGDARSHHAYLGGLLEHTVSVATLCQHLTVQHPRLDADLLLSAALLHDIGKVDEFTYAGRDGGIGLSREGEMLGHVLIGRRIIEEKIATLTDFPKDKELKLMHALISHHGELEWGAPKRPQSAEALVLHHIDNLDARVKGFLEVVEGSGQVSWPELRNYFRRPLDDPMAADRED